MKFCLAFLLTLCSCALFSQQKKLDSLLTINTNYKKEDSLKVIYLTNVFRQYARLNNLPKMEEYANNAIALSKKIGNKNSEAYVYERLGLCYHGKAMYLPAINAYTGGIDAATKANDKNEVAGLYLNLGALYSSIPDWAKALQSNQLAVNIYNELNDQNEISSCYMNIGVIYKNINQPQKALEYIKKALAIFKTQGNGINYGVALAYEQIGNIYADISDVELISLGIKPVDRFTLSMKNLQEGLAVANASSDGETLATSITISIGNLYEKAGNNSLAIINYEKGLKSREASENPEDLANIYLTLGNFYQKNNDLQKSIIFLQKSIETGKRLGLLDVQQKAYQGMSDAYEKTGVYDSAIVFYKKFIAVRDSIFNAEKEKEITRKQLTLDFSVKENDYKLVQQITDGKLKQQLLLATQQQQTLLLKQQQLQLVNKEKDLQRLTYLQKQAELQNEKQLQASLLQKNTLQSQYDKEVSSKQIAEQKLQISYDGKVKIFLAIAIGLALIVTGFIFYNQRKTARLNKIINEQKLSLEQLGNVKDKIFSVVSHDMRAPVNSLISFIDILDEGKIPQEKLALYAKELKQNLTYTSALMNNLLNWAASQMQGFKPVKEQFQPATLVTEITNTLQHHTSQKNITIHNQVDENFFINTDRNMLAAVLRNLISNAIKYSYKEGEIIITNTNTEAGCSILIADNGTGMNERQLMEFNSNVQQPLDSKRGTANEKGTGLGLLLCKSFIEQMDGSLKAKLNEKGTTFEIFIPM